MSGGLNVFMLLTDAYGGGGGIAAYNRDVIEALCESTEIDCVVALPRAAPNAIGPLPSKLQFHAEAARGAIAYLRHVFTHLGDVRRADVIYCAHINLAPLAAILGIVFRKPTLLVIYGIDAWQPTGRSVTNFFARRMTHYASISDLTRQRFAAWSGIPVANITLWPNAIRLEQYGLGPKPDAMLDRYSLRGKRVLLTFGRIVSKQRAKGFDEVVELMPRLRETVPNIVYMIAGDGEYRPALQDKVRRLRLDDCVVFTGFVSEADKRDLFLSADVYVMPSRGEGFGFVITEAMACGIPTIASTLDGGREATRDGMLGQIVNPDSPDDIMRAILTALEQPRAVPEGLAYFAFPAFARRVVDGVATIASKHVSGPA